MASILLAEDHEVTRSLVELYLRRAGHRVDSVCDGAVACALALQNPYDLLILDLMLPHLDGREICRRVRATSSVPVILLTALSTESDVIHGLRLGADDYVCKPFSPRELMARVEVRLRNFVERGEHRLTCAELLLDQRERQAYKAGTRLSLTATELRLLEVLIQAKGRAFSREELITRVLGHDFEGNSKTIDMHVSNLRKRIEADRRQPRYLLTIAGHGYRLVDPASDGAP